MEIKNLAPGIAVSAQIVPADIATIVQAAFMSALTNAGTKV